MVAQLLNMQSVILASGSPRRKQLLEQAELNFKVIKPNIDETHPLGYEAKDIPEYLARKKSAKLLQEYKNTVIISADTVVVHEGRILEKPRDTIEAEIMLKSMSGKVHEVITGVAFSLHSQLYSFSETTKVKFSNLTTTEIKHYVNRYKPFDKAGSYGIQEWIGLVGIEMITGCYYNVMGLPVNRLFKEIKKYA